MAGKVTDNVVSEVMRQMGRKGQKALRKKYSSKHLSAWGKKGGRPVNQEIQSIMKEHDCSRQTAYRILKGGKPRKAKR